MPLRKDYFKKEANKKEKVTKENMLNKKLKYNNNIALLDNYKFYYFLALVTSLLLFASHISLVLNASKTAIFILLFLGIQFTVFGFIILIEQFRIYSKSFNETFLKYLNLESEYKKLLLNHPKTKITWQATKDGVPGMDRPWRENDACNLQAINGEEINIKIDKILANDLNQAYNWTNH